MTAAASLALLLLICGPDLDRTGQKQKAAPLAAQERYDPIPVQGNIDAFLKQLLLRAEEEVELEKLFEQFRNFPMVVPDDLIKQYKDKAREPMFRSELLELIGKHKDGSGLTHAELAKLAERFKGLNEQGMSLPAIPGGAGSSLPPPGDDRLARMAKDWLKDMDESRAGDFLRDSPAWRNGLRDLDKLVQGADGKFDWMKRSIPDNLRLPKNWTPKLDEWTAKLPALPNLPRMRLSPPNLGGWNMNFGGGPRLGAPSVGGINVSENLLWLLVPLLVAVLAWLFYRNLGHARATAGLARRRGPWPVDPNAITTRTQLIQAFDYLALLLLGDEVRTWNHVAVAKKIGEESARSPAAAALARLYELARYTPGDDLLTADAQVAARRHLVALAGSAAA